MSTVDVKAFILEGNAEVSSVVVGISEVLSGEVRLAMVVVSVVVAISEVLGDN